MSTDALVGIIVLLIGAHYASMIYRQHSMEKEIAELRKDLAKAAIDAATAAVLAAQAVAQAANIIVKNGHK